MVTLKIDNLLLEYELTTHQVKYLRFIIEYAQDHNGNSPKIAKLADEFGVHWMTAKGHLDELSNKRLIRIEDNEIIVEDSVWEPPYHIEVE